MAASKPKDTATSKTRTRSKSGTGTKAGTRKAASRQARPRTRRRSPTKTRVSPEKQLQTLSVELERVQGELAHLKSAMYSEVKTDIDEGDVEVSERIKNVSLIAMLEQREQTLLDAIKSVELGQYGICNRCQTPITPERLEVLPDAKYCIRCQDEIERSARGLF